MGGDDVNSLILPAVMPAVKVAPVPVGWSSPKELQKLGEGHTLVEGILGPLGRAVAVLATGRTL